MGVGVLLAVLASASFPSAPGKAGAESQLISASDPEPVLQWERSWKVEQVIGDVDWATTSQTTRTPTVSQTITEADVVGTDTGYSFFHCATYDAETCSDGELIFLFGDTIGYGEYLPPGGSASSPRKVGTSGLGYQARDPWAWSQAFNPTLGLQLTFFMNGTTPQFIEPSQPAWLSQPINTGGDDIPNSGIALRDESSGTHDVDYIVYSSHYNAPTSTPHAYDFSVLVEADSTNNKFTTLRPISELNAGIGGHFIFTSLHELPAGYPGLNLPQGYPNGLSDQPFVLMYGLEETRQSDVYLALVPKSEFVQPCGQQTNDACPSLPSNPPVFGLRSWPDALYLQNLNSDGSPNWVEKDYPDNDFNYLLPVVCDNPQDQDQVCENPKHDLDQDQDVAPAVGNVSVSYACLPVLKLPRGCTGLWLMTYSSNSSSNPPQTVGVYFSYAWDPWGPWSSPQLIYNACRDGGFGNYIYYTYSNPSKNDCPGQGLGPAGPMIGMNSGLACPNGWNSSCPSPIRQRGGVYAPQMIEPYTQVDASTVSGTLTVYYTMSTWNPYTVVRMASQFACSICRSPQPIPTECRGGGTDQIHQCQ